MSLMAAAAGEGGLSRRRFAFPPAVNEEALAANGRATHQGGAGCVGCGAWMLSSEYHTLCHCEVADYADTRAVTRCACCCCCWPCCWNCCRCCYNRGPGCQRVLV